MAKEIYVGVDNKARKVRAEYVGVNNVARKVKKVYIGVNNVAQLCYGSGEMYLYNLGDECISVTGGFIDYANQSGTTVNFTKGADSMYRDAYGVGNTMQCYTRNTFIIPNGAKKLYMLCDWGASGSSYTGTNFGLCSAKMAAWGGSDGTTYCNVEWVKPEADFTQGLIALDIPSSAWGQSAYCKLTSCWAYWKIYKIWIE